MDLMKLTRELGKALQEDQTYLNYKAAEAKSDQDEALQEMIGEFNLKRVALNMELSNAQQDQERVKVLNEEIKTLYGDIMANPNMVEYNAAKNGLDTLMSDITSILSMCAAGEDPDTCEPHHCGGDCGSCGGCH